MKVRKIPDTINSFQQGINTRANLLMLMPPHSEGAQRSVYLAGFLFFNDLAESHFKSMLLLHMIAAVIGKLTNNTLC